nr:MAG TPA: hypothetical protein [Caudoviricetes sp.]
MSWYTYNTLTLITIHDHIRSNTIIYEQLRIVKSCH